MADTGLVPTAHANSLVANFRPEARFRCVTLSRTEIRSARRAVVRRVTITKLHALCSRVPGRWSADARVAAPAAVAAIVGRSRSLTRTARRAMCRASPARLAKPRILSAAPRSSPSGRASREHYALSSSAASRSRTAITGAPGQGQRTFMRLAVIPEHGEDHVTSFRANNSRSTPNSQAESIRGLPQIALRTASFVLRPVLSSGPFANAGLKCERVMTTRFPQGDP